MKVTQEVGERLKAIRKRYASNARQFALLNDFSVGVWTRIEKAQANLPDHYLHKLIDQYGLNVHWLVTGEEVIGSQENEGGSVIAEDAPQYGPPEIQESLWNEVVASRGDIRRALDAADRSADAAIIIAKETAAGLQQVQMLVQKGQEHCAVLDSRLQALLDLRQNDIHFLTLWMSEVMGRDQESLLADMRSGSAAVRSQP